MAKANPLVLTTEVAATQTLVRRRSSYEDGLHEKEGSQPRFGMRHNI
ncbi:MAG TPA: hypothetical protein V6C91_18460 [Coleofasciculaceae cyanobacterium]